MVKGCPDLLLDLFFDILAFWSENQIGHLGMSQGEHQIFAEKSAVKHSEIDGVHQWFH